MTTSDPVPEALPVTQEDEIAAQALANRGPDILRGIYRQELIAFLARHRLTSTPPPPSGDRVREALEPFVRHWAPWMDASDATDDGSYNYADDVEMSYFARVTFGDLRRARAALSAPAAPVVPEGLREAVETALKRWNALPAEERNGERPFVMGFNSGWEEATFDLLEQLTAVPGLDCIRAGFARGTGGVDVDYIVGEVAAALSRSKTNEVPGLREEDWRIGQLHAELEHRVVSMAGGELHCKLCDRLVGEDGTLHPPSCPLSYGYDHVRALLTPNTTGPDNQGDDSGNAGSAS